MYMIHSHAVLIFNKYLNNADAFVNGEKRKGGRGAHIINDAFPPPPLIGSKGKRECCFDLNLLT